jgi:hypothetical protein
MRVLTRFTVCLGIIATPLLFVPAAYAAVGDDNFLIIAQGVTGAPVGGTTGGAGNGGVGDIPAGEDRTQSYDAPSSPSMDNQTHRHQPRYNANDANGGSDYGNPDSTNSTDRAPNANSGTGTY